MSLLDGLTHGRLGLASGLPLHADVSRASQSESLIAVEFRPGKIVAEWHVDEGGAYSAAVECVVGGKRLDIVAVKSALDTGLVRAESIADCRANPGTYFYDPDAQFASPGLIWDSGAWDSGFYWDQAPLVYVHLADGSSPAATPTSVYFGLYVANAAMVQPTLGANKLINGNLEAWSSDTDCDDWTESTSGQINVTKESSEVSFGSFAARLQAENAGLGYGRLTQSRATVIGAIYRMSGRYKVGDGISPSLCPAVRVSGDPGGGTEYLLNDGRTTSSVETSLGLLKHEGEWRRFSFDFRAFAESTTVEVSLEGAGSGYIVFDDVRLQHIARYELYEDRLGPAAIPEVSVGSNDVYFGGKRTGIGTISLLNLDNQLTTIIGQLEVVNHEMIIRSGGAGVDGVHAPFEAWEHEFTGLVQGDDWSDEKISFDLLDHRINLHRDLPLRAYDEHPELDVTFLGKPRPLFFGVKTNITPAKIDVDGAYSKYGLYEIADCERAPNGIKEISLAYAYASTTAASELKAAERKQLVSGVDYSEDLVGGQFTILRDVGPHIVTLENNKLNFDVGGAELTATLAEGAYAAAELAAHVQNELREAVGGGDTSMACSYSETTNTFTIAKSSGTLNLKTQSGANKDISAYPLLGFSKGQDLTGALSYEADEAVFEEAEKDHVLRVNAKGFKDDATGTYTGVANALIEIGADICRVLLVRYLDRPPGMIDEASFLFARQRAPESLAIYLNEATSSKDVFDTLEFSNVANIVVGGDGTIYYLVYVGEVPANVTDLYERDFVEFKMGHSVSDVYGTIDVKFDRDPTTGKYRGRSVTDPGVSLRYNRPQRREFQTYIKTSNNAGMLANRLLSLASRPARKATVSTIGKMSHLKVGDKVRLSRSRALDPSGQVSAQVFRIISLSRQPMTKQMRAEMVDDVVTVAGVACITACQHICELFNQGACSLACQEACQLAACQEVCEQTSQGCGYNLCMTACESACQGCGQTSCQTTCELVSQGCTAYCETHCQGCGQTSCQTGCEVSCQSGCQASCQSGCEVNCQSCGQAGHCQSACETSCQGCGQTSCQTACEGSCQYVCQLGCMSGCQLACQSPSEEW